MLPGAVESWLPADLEHTPRINELDIYQTRAYLDRVEALLALAHHTGDCKQVEAF